MKKIKHILSPTVLICLLYVLGIVWRIGLYPSLSTDLYVSFFALDIAKIIDGEWWRLFTFVMIPPGQTVLWSLLAIVFLYILAMHLEELYGRYSVAVYFAFSVIIQTLIAWLFYKLNSRIVWLDLRIWWMMLVPLIACKDPKRGIYLLTPRPVRIVWLLPAAGVIIAMRLWLGTSAQRISILGQIISCILWMMGSMFTCYIKKMKA